MITIRRFFTTKVFVVILIASAKAQDFFWNLRFVLMGFALAGTLLQLLLHPENNYKADKSF